MRDKTPICFGVHGGLRVISVVYVIRDWAGIYADIYRNSTISGSSNTISCKSFL